MTGPPTGPGESQLVRELLAALLREDVGGLRSRGVRYRRRDGLVLAHGRLRVPVREASAGAGDVLADLVPRQPWLELVTTRRRSRLGRAVAVVRALEGELDDDPELAAGLRDLRVETLAAVRSVRLRRRAEAGVRGRLREAGPVRYETLAAFDDHPLHPLSAARVGTGGRPVGGAAIRAWAPEHRPAVVPSWVAVPAGRAELSGALPGWWPAAPPGEVALPVHPAATGELPGYARPLPGRVPVTGVPTLSLRTLALPGHPGEYLKLPVPVSTLGRRNVRRLGLAGLLDATLVQRLLAAVLEREPFWAGRIEVADESTWVWGGDPGLAAVVRRTAPPAGGGPIPVAALAARGVQGRPVAIDLAESHYGGDVLALVGDVLDALLGWSVLLWLRYGIALEAHPQNVCLTLLPNGIGLLVRDLDSARLDLTGLGRSLPEAAPGPQDLADPRLAGGPAELAAVVVTTTLHQCVATTLARLARRSAVPLPGLLALVPPRLRAAAAALGSPAAEEAVERVLAAGRLPVKGYLTAATLLPKHRTGPGDVNKYVVSDAPSYLTAAPARSRGPDPAEVTAAALVSCLAREVAVPAGRARLEGGVLHLDLDLGLGGARLSMPARGIDLATVRPHGSATLTAAGHAPREIGWRALAGLVDRHLGRERAPGSLTAQVAASHDLMAAVAASRRPGSATGPDGAPDGYLRSEQSLLAGHRHHPAPKARSGNPAEALEFAPETGARVVLHQFAVPLDALWQREAEAGAGLLDKLLADDVRLPAGHVLLPVHPWQLRTLRRDPATAAGLAAALRSGVLVDLGPGRAQWSPTASVRTLLRPGVEGFLKVSLGVRITNCVRVNPRPEIEAAVRLTGHLGPLLDDLARTVPGVTVLPEPAGRTLDDPELADSLGVLVRGGLPATSVDGRPVRPVLAAALVEPAPAPAIAALLARVAADRRSAVGWWRRYLGLLVPATLRALLVHGVALEPHLQNVVLLLDAGGRPAGIVLRDLEGAKLVRGEPFPARNGTLMDSLPEATAGHLGYTPAAAWNRVAYCLLVNHVATLAGALADAGPAGLERLLWAEVRAVLEGARASLGDLPGEPLGAVLAGGPVPAKANLLTRWHDLADRDSGYVPVRLPIG